MLFSLSEEAQAFVSEIVDDTFSIRLSIDLEPGGQHRASLHGPPDLAELFASLNLQARCDIVADGYNVGTADAIDASEVSPEAMKQLIESMELQDGTKVLDLMCGDGEVGQALGEFAQQQSIVIQLSMCDAHNSQLLRIDPGIRARAVEIKVGDARALPYTGESFDVVVLKMGLHEVPRIDQTLVVQEAYRVLKPGGRFVVWELLPSSGVLQDAFADIVQKSSMLAHCESQAFDRYFPREDQLLWYLKSAGFVGTEQVFNSVFRFSTQARLDAELAGDHSKLDILNRFARDRMTQALRDEASWRENGEDISMDIPECIYRTYKPQSGSRQ